MSTAEQAQLLANEHDERSPRPAPAIAAPVAALPAPAIAAPKAAAGVPGDWPMWRFIGAAILTAICIYITRQPWGKMIFISLTDEEASHVLLVPVAAAWLLMSRWRQLKGVTPAGTWAGPIILALGWASLLYGYDIRDNEFWFFGAILMPVGCLVAFWGAHVLWRMLPVVLVLGFLIPMPGLFRERISLPLQGIMAQLTQHLGDMFGFMISRSGNLLTINGQPIEIAEACSGMRMVFALFLVGFTVAFATPLRLYARVLVLAAAPLFALLCNLLRMLPTVWLYGHGSKSAADTFHDAAGWAMVLVAYFLMMGSLHLLEWCGVPVMQKQPLEGGAAR